MLPPINFKKWIEENRHLLKPPVGNKVVYKDSEFIIMVVGGPNVRKDYHVDEGEEFFYQLEGSMILKTMQKGQVVNIKINEDDIFLLPPKVPHSPQRFKNTIGLVIERRRRQNELDGFQWYCENCNALLYEKYIPLDDIVKQLPEIFDEFWGNTEFRTCKQCFTLLEKP